MHEVALPREATHQRCSAAVLELQVANFCPSGGSGLIGVVAKKCPHLGERHVSRPSKDALVDQRSRFHSGPSRNIVAGRLRFCDRGSFMHKVGVLIDSLNISKQLETVIARLVERGDVEIVLILHASDLAGTAVEGTRGFIVPSEFRSYVSRALFDTFYKLEHAALHGARDRLSSVNVADSSFKIVRLDSKANSNGLFHDLKKSDLDQIAILDLSVLCCTGTQLPSAEVSALAKNGTFYLQYGDDRLVRGGPVGFWEVFFRLPHTGYAVRRVKGSMQSVVVRRGERPTVPRFLGNLVNVLDAATEDFSEVVQNTLDGRPPPAQTIAVISSKIFRAPTAMQTARMMWRLSSARFTRAVNLLRNRKTRWRVGVLRGDWPTADLHRAVFLPDLPSGFNADPFVVVHEERTIVYVEQFDFHEAKGKIAAYEVFPDGAVQALGLALEEPFHLSFPFVFRVGDALFMCPETEQSNQVRLYRCVGFPLEWRLEAVLLNDIRAVDPVIFKQGDHWWMILGETQAHTYGARPLLFVADDVLGPWKRCPSSPISQCAAGGRNGGLLRAGKDIYRVVQNQGFNAYGQSISIFKINMISKERYSDSFVQTVRPSFLAEIEGGHHLHSADGWTVFDVRGVKRMRTSTEEAQALN